MTPRTLLSPGDEADLLLVPPLDGTAEGEAALVPAPGDRRPINCQVAAVAGALPQATHAALVAAGTSPPVPGSWQPQPQAAGHDQPAWRTDSLAASIAVLLALSLVQRLVGFIRQVLVCRWLEPNQLGQWDIAFRFLLLAAPVTVLGLPGSFGRYVEHFRRRGQLKTLLRRTTVACVLLCGLALILMSSLRTAFSELIYGTADQTQMVLLLGVSLVAVVVYNFMAEASPTAACGWCARGERRPDFPMQWCLPC